MERSSEVDLSSIHKKVKFLYSFVVYCISIQNSTTFTLNHFDNNNDNNNLSIFIQDCCISFKTENCYQCRSHSKRFYVTFFQLFQVNLKL